jgi:hypothetical protein
MAEQGIVLAQRYADMAARAAELDERPHARYPIAVCFGGIERGSFFELLQRLQKVCVGNDILTARNMPG